MRYARRMLNREPRIDYGIILSVIILAIVGLLSVYSTTALIEGQGILPTLYHALWYGIGAILIIILMQINEEQYWRLAPLLYAFGILLLVLVLFFYDREVAATTGARSWFRLGPLSFQPSEVFKPAYIVMLARIINEHNKKTKKRTIKTDWQLIAKTALITIPAALLILKQNDLGTTLVIVSIYCGMMLLSGISWKIIVPIALIVILLGGGLIYLCAYHRDIILKTGILQEYQLARIEVWLRPFEDSQGDAYQLVQSLKAVGSGRMFGKGFGVSEVNVPVRESDFIFTTIAENSGFLGATILLIVYFVLIYQMIQVAFSTRNEFYALIIGGVISMILFHVFENVGMNIGLLPITGVPLPFVSQGGSALVSNMIGIGLVLSMRYQQPKYRFSDQSDFN